ncbi:MAG: benzoate/H(+) symporter BenE family transporter [Alphaproteobacteria bacterium]|nr:benzoate/H(+) symporter BenE family transporter [Alphaproteobacteria bacterium]MBU0796366.1 benzoate/H(+) symporter BenE family transporter [Alphaproteobacteria bacterium]MBU0888601.1 benzoate/H(+) symporter BenE family transporter [Alphaproteobacteria bacterium]MBU1813665.1 benzoate/H(+) symporter BenE family transporter [Alphaproteobacteria bacterium]MBU2090313.1 benzoate/H(+) symporter BenE family transporter [Alphaproteobacteria bacterium]
MRFSVISSALVAVLVGFGGTLALVVAAAQAAGADTVQTASWVTGLCLAMAGSSAYLSIRHRIPVVTAWSTPGAALIAASAAPMGMEAAVGAFIFAAALILLTAAFRPISTLIERIPVSVAAAMLAGVLLRFVLAVFETAGASPWLVLPLVALFLVLRLASPPFAVLAVLAAGVLLAGAQGLLGEVALEGSLTTLMLIVPRFELSVLIGLGLPLYIVTMASQNLPGFAVLRAAGYPVPSRSILSVTGLASLLTAPLGAHTSNLAAITASLCTGPDAHPDKDKRWLTGPVYAGGYLVLALFGASLVGLFAALPQALVITIAGLALTGPLVGALGAALTVEADRFAAVLTLAVTASGLSLFGIGSAFWGLLAGLAALGLDRGWRRWGATRKAR